MLVRVAACGTASGSVAPTGTWGHGDSPIDPGALQAVSRALTPCPLTKNEHGLRARSLERHTNHGLCSIEQSAFSRLRKPDLSLLNK
jgi:hypothetical protein